MIRVLLVDDHPAVRAGYRRLLEQDGGCAVVAEAGLVDEALAWYAADAADLVITDLSMPGSGGLELIRRLRARHPQVRVLVFSMHDSDLLVSRALRLGARGFLSKTAAPQHLFEAVREVMAGRRYLSPNLTPELLSVGAPGCMLDVLTHRELEVFRLLAQGETLAGCARSLHLSPKTISNLQTSIKDKLGVPTATGMVLLALQHGLVDIAGQ